MFKQTPIPLTLRQTLLLLFSLVPFPSAEAQTPTPRPLELGQAIEQDIAANETHVYQITVAADQFVKLASTHGKLRGSLKLFDSNGKLLGTQDDLLGSGALQVQAIIQQAGVYRVELRAFRNQAAGRYKLTWLEARTPTARERLKQAIETQALEALRFFRAGQYAEALREQERELILQRQLADEEPGQLADLLSRIGDVATRLGDFARAEAALLEALPLIERRLGERHPLLPEILSSLAQLYLNYNVNLDKADAYLQRALALQEKTLGQHHIYVVSTLHLLGVLAFNLHDYPRAEAFFQRERMLVEQQPADDQQLAQPLASLGRVAHARGQFEQAEAFYQRALALREKQLGPEHPFAAPTIFSLGKLAQDRQQLSAAAEYYQRAYEIVLRAKGPDNPDTIGVLDALAQLKLRQGDNAAALPYQTQSLAAAQRNLRLLLSLGSEQQRRDFLTLFAQQTDTLLSWHLRLAPRDSAVQALAVTTLLQRKGLIQESFADTLAQARHRLDRAGQQTLEQWRTVNTQLARLVLDGPAPRTTNTALQQQLAALTQKREQLETELSRLSAGSFQPAHAVTLAEIRRALPPKAALLEFAVYRPFDPKAPTTGERYGAPRYAVYVLRPQGVVAWRDLGEAAPLEAALNAWRVALREPKRRDIAKLGQAVSALLLQPLLPLLNETQHLLIAPDGALNLIPFEALPETAGRFLVEKFAVSYLSSGRDLLRLSSLQAAVSTAPPLVIADPVFGEPGALANVALAKTPARRRSVTASQDLKDVYFAPLFATAQEARKIKTLFKDATVLTGAEATEAALKQTVAPRLLHIATHGFFLADWSASQPNLNPLLRSGLALAQANLRQQNTTGEDGILTALEAAGLNLWGTRLVTLSACDTGLGEVRNGEGVYGLRRAFTLAGAETLVMSLWPVSDQVTRELMTAFYTNLQHGQGRAAALRAAQLQLLKQPARRAPYYWASFIQAGEWGDLNGQR